MRGNCQSLERNNMLSSASGSWRASRRSQAHSPHLRSERVYIHDLCACETFDTALPVPACCELTDTHTEASTDPLTIKPAAELRSDLWLTAARLDLFPRPSLSSAQCVEETNCLCAAMMVIISCSQTRGEEPCALATIPPCTAAATHWPRHNPS